MIHAFALEPGVVATWGRREAFRFTHDKFGLGTPRVLLELPRFSDWKNDVYAAAGKIELSEKDGKRLEELFRFCRASMPTSFLRVPRRIKLARKRRA